MIRCIKQLKKFPAEIIPYNVRIYVVIQMLNILNYEVQQLRDTMILKINIFHLANFNQFVLSAQYRDLQEELDTFLNKLEKYLIKYQLLQFKKCRYSIDNREKESKL